MNRAYFHRGLIAETEDGVFLIGKKCRSCGQIQFPFQRFCSRCHGAQLEDVHIGRRGTLYTYTTTYLPAANIKPPFSIGYVQLPEGPRVLAQLQAEEGRPFAIGQEMALALTELWEADDTAYVGYCYRPADEEKG